MGMLGWKGGCFHPSPGILGEGRCSKKLCAEKQQQAVYDFPSSIAHRVSLRLIVFFSGLESDLPFGVCITIRDFVQECHLTIEFVVKVKDSNSAWEGIAWIL